ncbi:hypothetical protein VTL71DRAFT_12292 [Oculimacula yallundae]|uniref:Uncharacterized protein n=1 Tax=Oculimacula yallundae TaxID=86028 RepID=A0ABR4CNF4_9HELO
MPLIVFRRIFGSP